MPASPVGTWQCAASGAVLLSQQATGPVSSDGCWDGCPDVDALNPPVAFAAAAVLGSVGEPRVESSLPPPSPRVRLRATTPARTTAATRLPPTRAPRSHVGRGDVV